MSVPVSVIEDLVRLIAAEPMTAIGLASLDAGDYAAAIYELRVSLRRYAKKELAIAKETAERERA